MVPFSTLESGTDKTMPINLADRFMDSWLGDMRPRFHKEIRRDIPMPGEGPAGMIQPSGSVTLD